MNLDRAELTGAGAAVAFHIALIAALSMSLASVRRASEPPSMEVELVEDIGLQSATPEPATPPPTSQAPEIGPAEPSQPTAAIQPTPVPSIKPTQAKPQPEKPAKPAPHVSRIGDDFLKGIADSRASNEAAKPAAATFDARAKASIAALFQRLVQPCADSQVNPGEGANRIRVTLNLHLRLNGTLAGTPQIVRVSGVDDDNVRYEERVKDLAVAVYRECSPFRGLPPELYKTPEGGWSNINLTYKLP
jgi:hypothetical protein